MKKTYGWEIVVRLPYAYVTKLSCLVGMCSDLIPGIVPDRKSTVRDVPESFIRTHVTRSRKSQMRQERIGVKSVAVVIKSGATISYC